MEWLRLLWRVLLESGRIFRVRRAGYLSASVAFFALLSASPLALSTMAIVGPLVGRRVARAEVRDAFQGWLGSEWGDLVAKAVADRTHHSRASVTTTVFGLVVATFASSRLFLHTRIALYQLWAPSKFFGKQTGAFTRASLMRNVVAFAMTLICSAVMLASVLTRTVLSFLERVLPVHLELAKGLDYVLTLGLTLTFFASIYRYVSDVRVTWRDAFIGAAVSGVLFQFGRTLFATYVGTAGLHSTEGLASSVVLMLIWIHYSVQTFFFGGCFLAAWADARGRSFLE